MTLPSLSSLFGLGSSLGLNRREIPTLIIINHYWNALFPSYTLASITRDTFDHVPLVASISTSIPKRGSFRYEPSWALHVHFRASISTAWISVFPFEPPLPNRGMSPPLPEHVQKMG
jgi:hypothetical protein